MDYEAGDLIWYHTFGGGLRQVRVGERLPDVKHGRPGFVGVVVSGPEKGNPVWGYDYQIVELRLAAAPSSPVEHLHMDAGSAGAA
jgi:hypothetical protein